jgi:PAS domain S-box-containing protein
MGRASARRLVQPGVSVANGSASEAEEALHRLVAAEAKYRGVIDAAPDAIVIVTTDGTIDLVNRQAELLFGYDRDELLSQPVELLIPDRFRDRHGDHRAHYEAHPQTRPMGLGLELYARHRSGREFPVEISLSPMWPEGQFLVTAVIRDVSERKQTEQQLRQTADLLARQTTELARSNEELERFAYIASHDLQEPLRMVASYTQLLARRYRGKLDEDADEFIGYAVNGANRMQQLIRDLLEYSRVGTRGGIFAAVDCGELVTQVLGDLATAIGEAGAAVVAGPLPTVSGDRSQLRQLFQNLVENALKYRSDAPPVARIDATGEGDMWHFTVRDNGIGIAPEYADRIFVIFQRLHTQAEYPGTGIGLAVCKRIVERHGGRIWVESQPGEGATFHFTLPIGEV